MTNKWTVCIFYVNRFASVKKKAEKKISLQCFLFRHGTTPKPPHSWAEASGFPSPAFLTLHGNRKHRESLYGETVSNANGGHGILRDTMLLESGRCRQVKKLTSFYLENLTPFSFLRVRGPCHGHQWTQNSAAWNPASCSLPFVSRTRAPSTFRPYRWRTKAALPQTTVLLPEGSRAFSSHHNVELKIYEISMWFEISKAQKDTVKGSLPSLP